MWSIPAAVVGDSMTNAGGAISQDHAATSLIEWEQMYNVGHLKAPYLWSPSVVCPPQPMAMFSSSLSTHLKLPTLFTQLSEAASGFLRFRSWILEVESGIGTKPENIITSFFFVIVP